MKRITINEYTTCDFVDVYFLDTESEMNIFDNMEQGLLHDQASNHINNLIEKHGLTGSDKIVTHYFDKDEYLVQTEKMTIAEYKDWLEE